MNKKLYKLMNWAAIEEIIYSECDHPQELLGPHPAGNSTLIQAYFPGATSVTIKWISKNPDNPVQTDGMEIADEDGYFAILLPEKKVTKYSYQVSYDTKSEDGAIIRRTVNAGDPYRHGELISSKEIEAFENGSLINAYEIFGAHFTELDGEEGASFVVWAPNALRISVVGDFNSWDGRAHQMKRVDGGIFELFIPGVLAGDKFQYEIKLKGDITYKKNDPYTQNIVDGISTVSKKNVESKNTLKKLVSGGIRVLEFSGDHFGDKTVDFDKLLTDSISKAVKQGYNYVQINPAFIEGGIGINCSYLYSTSPDFESPDFLKKIVEGFHEAGIGVLFDWVPAGFGKDSLGMAGFDGTCLFEHQDPRQGLSADGKRYLYQYGKGQIKSFLLSNGLYWLKTFGADGLCMSGVAQMIYLDYGKNEGAWIPNENGGNENLDAIKFIKEFINLAKRDNKKTLIIAEDSSTHAGMTTTQSQGGMGFDYKWNEGFTGEYFDYISFDPIQRGGYQNQLTNELVYSYAERFILPLSGQLLLNNNGLLDLFPGDENARRRSLRLSLTYAYTHPGYKLVSEFMDSFAPELLQMLNELNIKEPALGAMDEDAASFEWLSNLNCDGCYISYIRKTDDPEEMMICVANFAGIEQTITTGVPYEGKYKEVINTDDLAFGGSGIINKQTLRAKDIQSDGRAQSISVKLAPLSMAIFKFIPYTETELAKVIEERIRRNTPIKKSVTKDKTTKK